MYQQIIASLRESYNRNAAERNNYGIETWKVEERQHFLELVQAEHKQNSSKLAQGRVVIVGFFKTMGWM